jgi:hypothetical protein
VASALGRLFSAFSEGRLDSEYDLSPRPVLSRRAAAEALNSELLRISEEGRERA